MRKLVIDGSNTSGFQRTALVAMNGALPRKGEIETICLEEEAAQRVKDDIFSLDRLGIPLVEITTSPCMHSPEEVQEVAEYIGMVLRSTGKVKRGIGTIRQDVNISIRGGARVKIKGVQELELIAEVVRREVQRQQNLLTIRDELLRKRASVHDNAKNVTELFKATKSTVLGTFWLSETPEVAGSRSWDAALPRIVTWGRLRDRRTGAVFHLFNTHFDHRGETARRESARLLLRKVAEIAGRDTPVVVTGDFNSTPDSEPYRILTTGEGARGALVDAMDASSCPHHGPTSSWNGFKAIEPGRRIDFVLVRPPVGVLQHGILSDTFGGRFPSDHLPVLAEVLTGGSGREPLCVTTSR